MEQNQLESITKDFLARLALPDEKPATPFVVSIIRIPGAGGTTVARALKTLLPGTVHVQANSARFLLKEAGLPWGDNVREVLRTVGQGLLAQGYGIILDGNALEQKDRDNIAQLAAPSGARVCYIRINVSPEAAKERERAKYDDPSWQSGFDDFRVNTTDKMLANIQERATVSDTTPSGSIAGLIAEIDNNGDLEDLDRQVRAAAEKIKTSLAG